MLASLHGGYTVEKFKKLLYPPDPRKTPGQTFHQILRSYTCKGFHWREEVVYRRQSFAVTVLGKHHVLRTWKTPELSLERGDLVRLENGKPCRCKECIAGRKEVRKGWTPWQKK